MGRRLASFVVFVRPADYAGKLGIGEIAVFALARAIKALSAIPARLALPAECDLANATRNPLASVNQVLVCHPVSMRPRPAVFQPRTLPQLN